MEAQALAASVPDVIWAGAFRCSPGYLVDQETHAKMPLGAAYQLVPGDCTDPATFALRVACMLRFYGCLSWEIAENFGQVLDIAAQRAHKFLHEDTATLPGLVQPSSAAWRQQVPKCDPVDLGITVTAKYKHIAEGYSLRMWKRTFSSLALNDKALALHCTDVPDINEASRQTAQEAHDRGQLLRSVKEMTARVNHLAETGTCDYAEIEALVASCNQALKRKRSEVSGEIPLAFHDYSELRVLRDEQCNYEVIMRQGQGGFAPLHR